MERLNLNETDTDIHPAVKRLLKEKTDKHKKINVDLQRRTSLISNTSTSDLKYKCDSKFIDQVMNSRFLRSYDSKKKDKDKEKDIINEKNNKTLMRRRTLYISGEEINEAKLDFTMECLDSLLNKKRTKKSISSKNTIETIRKSINSCKSKVSHMSKSSVDN